MPEAGEPLYGVARWRDGWDGRNEIGRLAGNYSANGRARYQGRLSACAAYDGRTNSRSARPARNQETKVGRSDFATRRDFGRGWIGWRRTNRGVACLVWIGSRRC